MKYLVCMAALLVTVLTGCDRGGNDPRLVLAEKCREDGDFQAAERQYRRYLQSHPQAAKVHLKLASLYDESMGDPAGAIGHYREYLRLMPDAPDAKTVKLWMQNVWAQSAPDAAKPAAAKPAAETGNPAELQRLVRENAALKRLVMKQQQELMRLRQRAVPAAAGAVDKETVYTVQSGDHLGKIARRFYGNSQKIEPILAANDLRPGSRLQVGQKLKIPKIAR